MKNGKTLLTQLILKRHKIFINKLNEYIHKSNVKIIKDRKIEKKLNHGLWYKTKNYSKEAERKYNEYRNNLNALIKKRKMHSINIT